MKKLAIGLAILVIGLGLSGAAQADEIELPVISVSPASYDFGNVPLNAVATGSLMVSNTGGSPLVVSAVKTKAPFGDNATSFTIQPGQSRRVDIYFAPTAATTYNSWCTFQSNAHNAPLLSVPLSGTGVE